jgi:RND family efflux transporter MFP subunit
VILLDDRDLLARRAQAQASVSVAQSGRASAEADGESAEARLALAQTNYRRIEQLREKNSATPQELDQATAELRMAEAAGRAARARLAVVSASVAAGEAASRASEIDASFSTITAPFDGIVTSKLIEPGNTASPGLPLLTIEATGACRLELQIDEGRARFLHPGDAVAVDLDGAAEWGSLTGRVGEIARAVDSAGHAFVVKVELPAVKGLRSGMFARARFEAEERKALVVPASAIVRRGQLSLVFVVDGGGRARMRAITTGARSRDSVEVLAGVQEGELVVLSPPASLVDGTVVRTTGGRP